VLRNLTLELLNVENYYCSENIITLEITERKAYYQTKGVSLKLIKSSRHTGILN